MPFLFTNEDPHKPENLSNLPKVHPVRTQEIQESEPGSPPPQSIASSTSSSRRQYKVSVNSVALEHTLLFFFPYEGKSIIWASQCHIANQWSSNTYICTFIPVEIYFLINSTQNSFLKTDESYKIKCETFVIKPISEKIRQFWWMSILKLGAWINNIVFHQLHNLINFSILICSIILRKCWITCWGRVAKDNFLNQRT